jgi:hypothetical protein
MSAVTIIDLRGEENNVDVRFVIAASFFIFVISVWVKGSELALV